MDFMASPVDDTPSPEIGWSTIGASRKPASATRPRSELITVGIQLPPGTLNPKLPLYDVLAAVTSTAQLSSKTCADITLQARPAQSLVFLKTHSPLTAHLLLSITHLHVEGLQQPTLHGASFSGPRHLFPVPGYWLKIVPTSLHLGLQAKSH
ncbi:uncharacterized protein LOC144115048 [Amblyomma americanum]